MAQQLEHLILGRAAGSHQVCSRSDVGLTGLRDEVELESIFCGCDAVGAGIVCSIQCTIGSTLHAIQADGGIPGVTSVAVGIQFASMTID